MTPLVIIAPAMTNWLKISGLGLSVHGTETTTTKRDTINQDAQRAKRAKDNKARRTRAHTHTHTHTHKNTKTHTHIHTHTHAH